MTAFLAEEKSALRKMPKYSSHRGLEPKAPLPSGRHPHVRKLLDAAKRAVEIAIEDSETEALLFVAGIQSL